MPYLLWRNVKRQRPHVDFLVRIHAGYDEEDTRSTGPTAKEPTESEYDDPFVLLNHLDREAQGEGDGNEYQKNG